MISIVVPVFNCDKYIEKCIESIIKQSFQNIEIIIIDDGSVDGTKKILDELSLLDNRIIVYHKKHGGLVSARREGVRLAKGDIIGFVDGDDYIEPLMYERLYCIWEANQVDLVSSGIVRDYEDGRRVEVVDNFKKGLYTNLERDIFPSMLFNNVADDFGIYCNLVTKLFRRNLLLEALEGIDSRIFYGEDAAILYRYCMSCKSIYILNESYYHYCIRNESICFSRNINLTQNTYLLYDSLKSVFEKSESRHVLMRQLKRYILNIETHLFEMLYDINPGVLNRWTFDYSENVTEDKYILYGAGGCGQAFYHYLRRNGKEKNLVSWIDEDYEARIKQCDYDLESVANGIKKEHRYILVAVKNNDVAQMIKNSLINKYGVSSSEVVLLNAKEESFFNESLF